jgi:hypothetical protein
LSLGRKGWSASPTRNHSHAAGGRLGRV